MLENKATCGFPEGEGLICKSAFEVSTEASLVLQEIYSSFKKARVCTEVFVKIGTDEDYSYIIMELYRWCGKNKMFPFLVDLYKQSAGTYQIRYGSVREFILEAFRRFRDTEVIVITVSSLYLDDVPYLIHDFEEYDLQISEGLRASKVCGSAAFERLVEKMVMSGILSQESVGSRCYSSLENPGFSLDHLLTHTKDEIVAESVNQLECGTSDVQLLSIIFRRGTLDYLASQALRKLDVSGLSQKDLDRIYSLFHISPLDYVRFGVHEFGFSLNEQMATDLIRELGSVFSEELFGKVASILDGFEMTGECYNQMISSLGTSNHSFKTWVFRHLRTESISLPFFIKVCWFVCNEDDLEIVRSAIMVLRAGRTFDIIEKWAEMRKLERLTRRVYPLRMKDPGFYRNLLSKCECGDERRMLGEAYDFDF